MLADIVIYIINSSVEKTLQNFLQFIPQSSGDLDLGRQKMFCSFGWTELQKISDCEYRSLHTKQWIAWISAFSCAKFLSFCFILEVGIFKT